MDLEIVLLPGIEVSDACGVRTYRPWCLKREEAGKPEKARRGTRGILKFPELDIKGTTEVLQCSFLHLLSKAANIFQACILRYGKQDIQNEKVSVSLQRSNALLFFFFLQLQRDLFFLIFKDKIKGAAKKILKMNGDGIIAKPIQWNAE